MARLTTRENENENSEIKRKSLIAIVRQAYIRPDLTGDNIDQIELKALSRVGSSL